MGTYLDWNATTPRHPDVLQAMREVEEVAWANPSSVHAAGRAARRIVEDVREQLAAALSRSPRDVVFTGGGTEANHLALAGARWLVTSRIEHPSIVAQAEHLAEGGARVAFAAVSRDGLVTPEAVDAALHSVLDGRPHPRGDSEKGGNQNSETPLVAVMAANHETGAVQPLREIKDLCLRWGARLHVDAVQWVGRGEPEHLLLADSLSVAAHKMRGPKGIGALLFDCGFVPTPLGRGGAQERGLRPGTVDASALAGWGAALQRLPASLQGYVRAAQLGEQMVAHIQAHSLRPVEFAAQVVPRMAHCVNVAFEGWKGDELVAALDLLGVCVSSGSACSAGTSEPSPVIEAMLGRERASRSLRISLGEESNEADLEALFQALRKLGILAM